MAFSGTTAHALQAIGLTSTGILTGLSISYTSQFTPLLRFPATALPTSTLLTHWRRQYRTGAQTMPALALGGSLALLASSYNSYLLYANPTVVYSPLAGQWKGFAAAAALCLGIVPYTLGVMLGTNKALFALEEAARSGKGVDGVAVKTLLARWARLNAGRAVMLGLSAVVAAWTALA
jgi:hypothetical protein